MLPRNVLKNTLLLPPDHISQTERQTRTFTVFCACFVSGRVWFVSVRSFTGIKGEQSMNSAAAICDLACSRSGGMWVLAGSVWEGWGSGVWEMGSRRWELEREAARSLIRTNLDNLTPELHLPATRKRQKGKKKKMTKNEREVVQMPQVRRWKHARVFSNLWAAETPGKTLRFQDKRIPLYLGVRLRLASDSKYLKRSLTRWLGVRQSKLQNKGLTKSPELRNMFFFICCISALFKAFSTPRNLQTLTDVVSNWITLVVKCFLPHYHFLIK